MTLTKVLRDLKEPCRVHGFRSTFADWRGDETDFPEEITEAALAHEIPDEVRHAYKRTDFFDKRRALMAEWSAFCTSAMPKTSARGAGERPQRRRS